MTYNDFIVKFMQTERLLYKTTLDKDSNMLHYLSLDKERQDNKKKAFIPIVLKTIYFAEIFNIKAVGNVSLNIYF